MFGFTNFTLFAAQGQHKYTNQIRKEKVYTLFTIENMSVFFQPQKEICDGKNIG